MEEKLKIEKKKLTVTILGSGTSTGVPVIGCTCRVCKSSNLYNKRLRSSILISDLTTNKKIIIDTTPDFRSQMLSAKVSYLDAVLFTHTHADHCHGFDDLRQLAFTNSNIIPCWARQDHIDDLKNRFSYVFTNQGYRGITPKVVMNPIENSPISVAGLEVEWEEVPHGHTKSTAFKFGDFVYITDFKMLPENIIEKWKGKISTMIASGVRHSPHPTHSSIPQTCELFNKLEVNQGYITHLSHDVDHVKDSLSLPSGVKFAHDGLKIEI